MKVLLVQKMAGVSGSERYFLALLPTLRAKGVDARFLVVQHPGNLTKNLDFIAELRDRDVPVEVINSRLPISPWLVWRIAALIRRDAIDILQTNLIHADVWGACARMLTGSRLRIVSVKHGYGENYQTKFGLDPAYLTTDQMAVATRWAARRADRVICISKALEEFFIEGKLIDSDRTITVPLGFDFSGALTAEAPGALRFDARQIVVAGRLVPVKQHHLLLALLPELVEEFPDLSVVMVGAGPLLEELQAQTERLGLSGHVRWEGFRNNMHDYIRDSDLMVVPSSAEGFGLVVLEAWYHGKPVVAFDVPAINEIVESGVDGELVPPFDTEAMQAVLRRLLSDRERTNSQGEAGRAKLRRLYDLEAMADSTISVYKDVMA